jgi:hypothetical protein
MFLIDTGADRTVFSAGFLGGLHLAAQPAPSGLGLQGVGGSSRHVIVNATVQFSRDDGGSVRMQGSVAAFTDPAATDMSILGRDILDHFDLIVSRRRNEVLLLAGNDQYQA